MLNLVSMVIVVRRCAHYLNCRTLPRREPEMPHFFVIQFVVRVVAVGTVVILAQNVVASGTRREQGLADNQSSGFLAVPPSATRDYRNPAELPWPEPVGRYDHRPGFRLSRPGPSQILVDEFGPDQSQFDACRQSLHMQRSEGIRAYCPWQPVKYVAATFSNLMPCAPVGIFPLHVHRAAHHDSYGIQRSEIKASPLAVFKIDETKIET